MLRTMLNYVKWFWIILNIVGKWRIMLQSILGKWIFHAANSFIFNFICIHYFSEVKVSINRRTLQLAQKQLDVVGKNFHGFCVGEIQINGKISHCFFIAFFILNIEDLDIVASQLVCLIHVTILLKLFQLNNILKYVYISIAIFVHSNCGNYSHFSKVH